MMLQLSRPLLLSLAIIMSLIIIFSYYTLYAPYTASTVNCYMDDFISEHAKNEINTYLSSHLVSTPHAAVRALIKNFTFLHQVKARSIANGTLLISTYTYIPKISINNMYVITSTGRWCNYEDFNTEKLNNIPTIWCTQLPTEEESRKELTAWALTLPSSFFDTYQVQWRNEHTIWLTHKTSTAFTLLTSIEVPLTEQLIKQCTSLVESAKEENSYQPVVIDIRFKNQLVCYKNSIGGTYGAHFT